MNTQPFGQTGQMIELCSEYLSVRCIWLYLLVMSRMRLRVNPQYTVAWMSRNSLLEAGVKSEGEAKSEGEDKFFINFCVGVWLHVLSMGVTSPYITPVQLENQRCPLRFSACAYPQQGNFHEKHCKGAWLASHVSVVLMPTHITPVKKGEKKN